MLYFLSYLHISCGCEPDIYQENGERSFPLFIYLECDLNFSASNPLCSMLDAKD